MEEEWIVCFQNKFLWTELSCEQGFWESKKEEHIKPVELQDCFEREFLYQLWKDNLHANN